MEKKYKIIETLKDGSARLMMTATVKQQAYDRLKEIQARFKDRSFYIQIGGN